MHRIAWLRDMFAARHGAAASWHTAVSSCIPAPGGICVEDSDADAAVIQSVRHRSRIPDTLYRWQRSPSKDGPAWHGRTLPVRILNGYAGATGAHMHICHFNGSSKTEVERSVELLEASAIFRSRWRVTTSSRAECWSPVPGTA